MTELGTLDAMPPAKADAAGRASQPSNPVSSAEQGVARGVGLQSPSGGKSKGPLGSAPVWQHLTAVLLSSGALGLGFFMVSKGYDSTAGWVAVSIGLAATAIVSRRATSAPKHQPERPDRNKATGKSG